MRVIARMIIQMTGAPKKHIEETLRMYIAKIKDEHKGIKILKEETSDAEPEGEMFNIFSELEVEAKDTADLVWFCFDYMPSSVEIIEPENIMYDSHDFTNFLNDLQAKLHNVDMVIKNLSAENQVIKKNGVMLMKNILMLQIKMGIGDIKTLALNAGTPQEHAKKFCEALVKEGKIKKDGSKYIMA